MKRFLLALAAISAITVGFSFTNSAMASKGPPHHSAPHHAAPRPNFAHVPHHNSYHHHGGYHSGGYPRVTVYNYGYNRGYHRTGYYRHRGNGLNSQMAWMSRMYWQQYQMMARQRKAELKAFMAAFDTNHNGVIDGKERGPAEKYLRERRLGKIPPLAIA